MKIFVAIVSTAINVWLWCTFGNAMSWLSGFIVGSLVVGGVASILYTSQEK